MSVPADLVEVMVTGVYARGLDPPSREVLVAALAALEAAGWRVLPVEPTEEMMDAAAPQR